MVPSSDPINFNNSCGAGVSTTTESVQPTIHTVTYGRRLQWNQESVYFLITQNQMAPLTGTKLSRPWCSTGTLLIASMGWVLASWFLGDQSEIFSLSNLDSTNLQMSGLIVGRRESWHWEIDWLEMQKGGLLTPGTFIHCSQVQRWWSRTNTELARLPRNGTKLVLSLRT